jgi:hypothetical protein
VKPDRFPDAPPDPVTHHGFADGAGDRETDTRSIGLGLAYRKSGKQRAGKLRAPVVNPSEIFGAQQADTFRKTSDGNLPLGADRELFASTGTAAGEHGASVLRLHPGTEAVRLGTVAIIRLKGAFRHGCSSI